MRKNEKKREKDRKNEKKNEKIINWISLTYLNLMFNKFCFVLIRGRVIKGYFRSDNKIETFIYYIIEICIDICNPCKEADLQKKITITILSNSIYEMTFIIYIHIFTEPISEAKKK